MIKEKKRRSLRVRRKLKLRTPQVRLLHIIDQLIKNKNNHNHLLNNPPRPLRLLAHPRPLGSNKRKKRRKRRSHRHYPNPRKQQVAATANTRHLHPHQKGSGHQRERRRLILLKTAEGNEREVNLREIGEGEKIPQPPLGEGEGTTPDHPPHPDEAGKSIPVHPPLPEDDAKIIAPLLPEGGENMITHLPLPGKDVDDRTHPRHEAGNVEKKGCRLHPLEDAADQVRHLPLLVG